MRSLTLMFVASAALLLGGCKQDLYSGLSERDANEMLALLLRHQVDASRERADNGTYVLRIDKSSLPDAMRLLSDAGLPRATYKTVEDIFPPGKLIQTPSEQRLRVAFALGQDMARSISAIQGVTLARVHVALGQLDARGASVTRPTASVVVRYGPTADLDELPTQARAIVASGIEGLLASDVKVILSPAGGKTPDPSETGTAVAERGAPVGLASVKR